MDQRLGLITELHGIYNKTNKSHIRISFLGDAEKIKGQDNEQLNKYFAK